MSNCYKNFLSILFSSLHVPNDVQTNPLRELLCDAAPLADHVGLWGGQLWVDEEEKRYFKKNYLYFFSERDF